MTRNQIWITVGAVAGALALGIGITLAVTGGNDTNQISTEGTRPTTPPTTTTIRPATTPPPTAAPTTAKPATPPTTTPPPTVIVVPPPTNAPTSPPTNAPTSPPTSPPTTAPPPTTKPTIAPTTAPPPTDPGITPTEIHLAVIADSQDSIQGVNVWAQTLNAKKGGLAGRKIVIDPFVVNGDSGQYAAAVNTACGQDFAIVGSLSTADNASSNLGTCGIPDLPARALSSTHRANPGTYAVVPTSSTKEQVGGFKWLLGAEQGCCKQYVIASTNAAAAAATQQSLQAADTVGFTLAGTTQLANDAPASSYTTVVGDMHAKAATFGRSDLPFASTISLRTEAEHQNLTGVTWFCLAQCYQPTFLSQGGAAVEGQFLQIATNPFEDAAAIPAMKTYLTGGGPQDQVGLESYSAGILFQTSAANVVKAAGKNGLTRAALLQNVSGINSFTAGGILGATNVGGRTPNGCFVLMKVSGGKFVRAQPTAAKSLSCGDQNLLTVGP